MRLFKNTRRSKNEKRPFYGLRSLKRAVYVLLFVLTLTFSSSYTVKQAEARCCVCCPQPVLSGYHIATTLAVTVAYDVAFRMLRDQLLSVEWWRLGVEPLAKTMALELSTHAAVQLSQIGAFMDGRNIAGAQLDMQILNAKSIKRHIPSVSMCKFASLNKSIAKADTRANMVQAVLSEFSMKRVLGEGQTIGALKSTDTSSRIKLALERHCSPQEFGGEMDFVCPAGTGANGYTYKDINYTEAVEVPKTINFSVDGEVTIPANSDEITNVLAMKQFLYNAETPSRIGVRRLAHNYDSNQGKYLKWRGTVAKRSVAENSFDTLIGMKATSGVAADNQYRAHLATLGVSAAEIDLMSKAAPSYWAQMEHLTKTLYQTPEFYANLYDNPGNVMRQSASMEAISLMQMRDYYESLIRSEMALALLLDGEVAKEQDALNNALSKWGH